jgi:hypothetical protein
MLRRSDLECDGTETIDSSDATFDMRRRNEVAGGRVPVDTSTLRNADPVLPDLLPGMGGTFGGGYRDRRPAEEFANRSGGLPGPTPAARAMSGGEQIAHRPGPDSVTSGQE